MLRLGRRVGFSFGGLGRGGGRGCCGWWVVGGLERLIHLGVEVERARHPFSAATVVSVTQLVLSKGE